MLVLFGGVFASGDQGTGGRIVFRCPFLYEKSPLEAVEFQTGWLKVYVECEKHGPPENQVIYHRKL